MIDQSHTIETKIEAMIMSIINCQTALAKALIVDYPALQTAQLNGDILVAQSILAKAFETDVYPLLEEVREEMGVPRDPLSAYRKDNYRQKIIKERGISEANNGYPV
jgi:L-rhamnose isomerase/sugar isomerase